MSRTDIAAVVIGRNEGPRLGRCLASIGDLRAVYVDSGSTDGSADIARVAGFEVIELERENGYTAARGRNAGLDRLMEDPTISYIQMVDGDCTLEPGWIAAGAAALDADQRLGAVFGQLREARPDESIYAWLCDIEWAVPPGPARLFSGNVLLRTDAVRAAGRYRAAMVVGEDPEYAIRLRDAGWLIACLADPMAVHDAGMTRFGQWWRRSVRAGHAFAALDALHPGAFAHNVGRILFWGGVAPVAAVAGLILSATLDPRWLWLSTAALLLTAAQVIRIGLREMRHRRPARAFTLALFLGIGKYAEMAGLLRFHLRPRR
ncbi:glycosyltransferase [Sphingomonas sp. SRS2]|uniref:glycosyltransferase n=1 Tax=Sphingomonas sp. SRS2 TaxID=133190 RepID=UPI0006184805|nr:glycosyltransferase family A protein [Sphingomonas sp. SRS2]KKC25155.1 hypothetical protein WP12_15400 [Sphingomonas sp. SRS2]